MKENGLCSFKIGFGKETAWFVINQIHLENNNIKIQLKEKEDDIPVEFIGYYDILEDILDLELKNKKSTIRFIFIRASKLNEILLNLGYTTKIENGKPCRVGNMIMPTKFLI